MNMKNLITLMILALLITITSSAFAGTPQTPEDCYRIYAGDEAKIQACMDSLSK